MAKKQSKYLSDWLHTTAVRVTRVHFVFIAAFIISIVVFDSWNLYTHEAALQLWTAAGVLLVINTVLWYLARMKWNNLNVYIAIVMLLVVADIIFAAYNVSWQRGLASKSVMLFTIPIVTSAVLRSRSALLATTTLSVAAYSIAAVRYFFDNYGQAYRIELWGTVAFYSAVMFILAFLLMIIIIPKNEKF